MILEFYTKGLRDDILVAEIQKVCALQQHIRQHEDHKRVTALVHRLLHDGQELVFALHHAFGINTGDLADTEVVVSNMEILEIREQQRIGGLIVGDGRGENGLAQFIERDIGDTRHAVGHAAVNSGGCRRFEHDRIGDDGCCNQTGQLCGRHEAALIMTVCPHLANQLSPLPALLINIAALAVLILFGCHNPFMFNQSTLVLGYLLLYGYDVSGKSYMLRIAGMAAGAAITCLVFYRNHKNRDYKRNMKAVIEEFDLSSSRTKWQLCQILCVPLVLCIAQLCNMPRAMWAGIAAMSAILPFMEDMQYRVKKRIVGNIAGVICFTVLYLLLPPSIYAYIGIIGGIGVGLSAQYGWQAVFNTFGALAIAAESYGLKGAVSLRVIQNVFGVVFALVFCAVFYRIMSVKVSVKEKAV